MPRMRKRVGTLNRRSCAMRTPARTWVVPDGPDGNLLFLFLLLMQAASGLAAASIDPFLTCAASGNRFFIANPELASARPRWIEPVPAGRAAGHLSCAPRGHLISRRRRVCPGLIHLSGR